MDGSNSQYYLIDIITYDIHGNVDTLVQDYNGIAEMKQSSNTFKLIAYDYDLISGKVNGVSYQPGKADAFYHRYSYDAENRLTKVETSRDRIYWEREAQYSYYRHGPLSRVVLGAQQVQGMDYAYTLQGWLKGVNSTSVNDGSFDMGKDGFVSGSVIPPVARDAYGFSLHYFDEIKDGNTWIDYKPVGNGGISAFTGVLTPLGTSAASLYNGNIAAMTVNIPKLGQANIYNFKYDQLNRLVQMDAYNGLNNATNVFTPVSINDYKERLSYDPNGNILTYLRNGTGATVSLNNYSYAYQNGANRLLSISNSVNSSTGSYEYDAIGNVTKDTKQGVLSSTWNVYGKLQSVQKTDGTAISYTYDAAGQRISKTVGSKKEIYVRDAAGNIMATYVKDASINSGRLSTSEFNIYGSGLLGTHKTVIDVEVITTTATITFVRGETEYLLTDHRGNNMVAVSDKKLQHSTNGTIVDYYLADVKTASYYSSFGAISNSFNGDKIDRAFNGQKRSTEISATAQTAEFWEYDGDVGRRWNVDPKAALQPGWTSYRAFYDNPIKYTDPNGALEYESAEAFAKANKGKTWEKDRGKGDWLRGDRELNSTTWQKANAYNLQQKDGFKQYTTIEQRAGFYGWYTVQEDLRGGETKWAGAAYIVAKQMTLMDIFYKSGDLKMLYGAKNAKDLNGFANAGNKAIFEDVFSNLRDNMNAAPKKGLEAKKWDAATLHHEQFDVVQPLYTAWTKYNPSLTNYLQEFASGKGLARFMQMPPQLKFEGNIMNPQDRYNHGMNKIVPYYEMMKKYSKQ